MKFKSLILAAALFSQSAFAADPATDVLEAAVANNNFGWSLWQKVKVGSGPVENVLISALSANLALSLASNGATDETYEEMRQALSRNSRAFGTPEATNVALQALVVDLLTAVETDESLSIANAMWANSNNFKFKDEFVFTADSYYRTIESEESIARSEAFSDPVTLQNINDWVKLNTNGMIPSILDDLDNSSIAVLLNALFFEGQWLTSFDERFTKDADFTKADGQVVDVQMMSGGPKSAEYAENEDYQFVSLKFRNETKEEGAENFGGRPGRYAVDLVLAKGDGVSADLDQTTYEQLLADAEFERIALQVPKFKFAYKNTLNDELKALGMRRAFTGNAQFSKLGEDPQTGEDVPASISLVLQKTAVEMSEGGFKAAAVTAVVFERSSGPTRPTYFVADKPFYLTLRDTRTNLVLFQGVINDPKWD